MYRDRKIIQVKGRFKTHKRRVEILEGEEQCALSAF